MADNLTTQSVTPATIPASTVIATDDAGAAGHVQVVKLAISTDGSATPLNADNTNGLLVNLGSNNDVTVTGAVAVTNAGTFAVQESGAALTSLQLIDDTVATTASTIPAKGLAIAGTDGTNARVIKTDTNGELQIDVLSSALPTGAATAANQLPDGHNVTIDNAAGVAAVNIQDGGNSITVDNGGTFPVQSQPFSAMLEGGLTELVGINEQVDQNDYSGSVGVSLGATYSGEILSVAFYATEDGTGAVQDSAGILYVFDADPTISSGDTSMTAAERVTIIGKIAIGAADWDTDANGGLAYVTTAPIPFHAVSTLYFVWKHLDATSLNDAAGDDEQLEFNFWYRRES